MTMDNSEKYLKVFMDTFEIDADQAKCGNYDLIEKWDSVGHMQLINNLEEAFNIYFETEDIVDFISFEAGKRLLKKYNVEVE